jgi:hypothetical protein
MLYYHRAEFNMAPLPELPALRMKECDDAHMLSVIGNITLIEVTRRLANDNRAFVAWHQDKPAAFGWSASGKAKIGELNHEMILPLGHRYLWNFRTLADFRGLGIYPRLLQYIVGQESVSGEWLWVMHAPENKSSARGIRKAGFQFAADVSFRKGEVIFRTTSGDESCDLEAMVLNLGFSSSVEEQATCWTCSSPFVAHDKGICCCEKERLACNSDVFR